MKISYNELKKHVANIGSPEEVAELLIMHTAEVEEIEYEWENLQDVYIGEVLECKKHPDAEKLNVCQVSVLGKTKQIVCGAPNVQAGIKVAVAVVGAKLSEDFVIKKTKIRGETSEGMLCGADEIGLTREKQAGIMILPEDAPLGENMRSYTQKNNAILEVDNKAINHRPDMFSHIGVIRELNTIMQQNTSLAYENTDFSHLPNFEVKNMLPEIVARYSALKIENISNTPSPKEISEIIEASWVASKGILVDISNYALYFYGQPTHLFDADTITGGIQVRYAKKGETLLALDDKEYELSEEDIVIADEKNVIALAGIIGGKNFSVTESTKNVLIESANFPQEILRKSGRRLGVRTDSLNVFEKSIPADLGNFATSLIAKKLSEFFPESTQAAFGKTYDIKQTQKTISHDAEFTRKLIGKNYSDKDIENILARLGIEKNDNTLSIPFWRTDLAYKADIAEEIARIDGYNTIATTIPELTLGAVVQNDIYKLKKNALAHFSTKGYFDMYNYSFVNGALMEKMWDSVQTLVALKNSLSEEQTHMRGSLIPNLLLTLEKNILNFPDLKLIELEKIFQNNNNEIHEYYALSGVICKDSDILYYDIQSSLTDFFNAIGIQKYKFRKAETPLPYAHAGRVADIIIRGKKIGSIGEIHPRIAKNFSLEKRVAFFEIEADTLAKAMNFQPKAKEISNFQANQFDINFVIDKNTPGKKLVTLIEKTDPKIIQNVELFDIYENEEKLPGKRSISLKISIQSLDGTLGDEVKNTLIQTIVKKAEKIWATLR